MAGLALPRLPISPAGRRVLAAAVAIGGVLVVGSGLKRDVPREIEVHVPLGAIVREGYVPRDVEVTLSRGTTVVRSLHRRYGTDVPSELVETLALPECTLEAHVAVTVADRVFTRDTSVAVRPGEPLILPAPVAVP